jgi:hypothetical protein
LAKWQHILFVFCDLSAFFVTDFVFGMSKRGYVRNDDDDDDDFEPSADDGNKRLKKGVRKSARATKVKKVTSVREDENVVEGKKKSGVSAGSKGQKTLGSKKLAMSYQEKLRDAFVRHWRVDEMDPDWKKIGSEMKASSVDELKSVVESLCRSSAAFNECVLLLRANRPPGKIGVAVKKGNREEGPMAYRGVEAVRSRVMTPNREREIWEQCSKRCNVQEALNELREKGLVSKEFQQTVVWQKRLTPDPKWRATLPVDLAVSFSGSSGETVFAALRDAAAGRIALSLDCKGVCLKRVVMDHHLCSAVTSTEEDIENVVRLAEEGGVEGIALRVLLRAQPGLLVAVFKAWKEKQRVIIVSGRSDCFIVHVNHCKNYSYNDDVVLSALYTLSGEAVQLDSWRERLYQHVYLNPNIRLHDLNNVFELGHSTLMALLHPLLFERSVLPVVQSDGSVCLNAQI